MLKKDDIQLEEINFRVEDQNKHIMNNISKISIIEEATMLRVRYQSKRKNRSMFEGKEVTLGKVEPH
jgi:hypothetical protein